MFTQKQEQFCREYIVDLNATQAAIRAGYSNKTASEQASILLRKVEVQAKINSLVEDRNKRTGVKADDVVRELAAIGFANIRNCFDKDGLPRNLEDMPGEVSSSLETYKVERDSSGRINCCQIKLHNKIISLRCIDEAYRRLPAPQCSKTSG